MALSEALTVLLIVNDGFGSLAYVDPLVLLDFRRLNFHRKAFCRDGYEDDKIASVDMVILDVVALPHHHIVTVVGQTFGFLRSEFSSDLL